MTPDLKYLNLAQVRGREGYGPGEDDRGLTAPFYEQNSI